MLFGFSSYAIPVLVGFISLLALIVWKTQYASGAPQLLDMRVFKSGAAVAPSQSSAPDLQTILNQITKQAAVPFVDTDLNEGPFWLYFTSPAGDPTAMLEVEFPSRHAVDVACWNADSKALLGRANRDSAGGQISEIKAGFMLVTALSSSPQNIICQVFSVGPARITALSWQSADLQMSAQEFHRKSGLLEGGILILAVFVLVTAMINRSALYLLFAAWLVVNLRMGALSAGWDSQWLGFAIPSEGLVSMRAVTMAVYFVLSVTLFGMLFRDELVKVETLWLMRIPQWFCLPLLAVSALLPYRNFLPFLWIATGVFIGVMLFSMAKILFLTRSKAAIWYSASISITLAASLYEVIAAALGVKGLIGSFNSVTAALSSSLLAAVAIAAQMRQEHEKRLEVQAELQHTYEAMPIGLFTLDLRGRFLSANPALMRMLGHKVLEKGGRSWQRYFNGGAWAQLHNLVHSQSDGELEIKGRAPLLGNREVSRFLVKATLARDRIEGSLQNVTEKAKATEELLFLVNNDPLTKVLNRRGIEKALDSAMSELANGKPLALAYLDLDRFRLINDLFGHNAGDEVLQQVCQRVIHMISGAMQFGRVGGTSLYWSWPTPKFL